MTPGQNSSPLTSPRGQGRTQGDGEPAPAAITRTPRANPWPPRGRGYVRSVLVILGCTALAALLHPHFAEANVVMVYLLGVMWVAIGLGRGPAILAAVLSVASFDFFFVPPHLAFEIADAEYLMTFTVMLVAAILIGTLAGRLRSQVQSARVDEHRSAALSRLSGELVALQDRDRILKAAIRHLEEVFESRAVVLLPERDGRLAVTAGDPTLLGVAAQEVGVAQWAFDAGQPAGLGTATLTNSRFLHLPLRGSSRELGVIAIAPSDIRRLLAADAFHLLRAFANHTALALERAQLAEEAEQARVQSETERLRSALLSSISHDLRTPLAVITGATSTLLENEPSLTLGDRRELLKTVGDEAGRLNRLVTNLLAMTRLEAGALEVKRSWHSMEEIVGAALNRLDPFLGGRAVTVEVASHVPLVPVDDVLIEQVVFNLVENSVKHAPSSEPIGIRVRTVGDDLEVSVTDRGPGFEAGTGDQLFEKFYRGAGSQRTGGVGLGLTICRGIVAAHGGTIRAVERGGRGAQFVFTLPLGAGAPPVEAEPIPAEAPAGGGRLEG